jgi:hypothetical protein
MCGSDYSTLFSSFKVFGKMVDYFECSSCSYVQTEEPVWLDQAYASPINKCDTGIMLRNNHNVRIVLATLATLGIDNSCVIDCAGGYGILVRLLRDQGVEALWSDPYCKNLLAKGFEHKAEKADLVTAFEAFEHFIDPSFELEKLLSIAPNLLISTQIMPSPTPALDEWWYYGLDHGQHIGFFRVRSLEILAKKFGKHFSTDGYSYHLFTESPISPTLWRLRIKLALKFPNIFTRGLRSKTWDDFKKMRISE